MARQRKPESRKEVQKRERLADIEAGRRGKPIPEGESERIEREARRASLFSVCKRASRTNKVTINMLGEAWLSRLPERERERLAEREKGSARLKPLLSPHWSLKRGSLGEDRGSGFLAEREAYMLREREAQALSLPAQIIGSARADYDRAIYIRVSPKTYLRSIGEQGSGKDESRIYDPRQLDNRLGLRASSPSEASIEYDPRYSERMLGKGKNGKPKPMIKPSRFQAYIELASRYELEQAGIEYDPRIAQPESERIEIEKPYTRLGKFIEKPLIARSIELASLGKPEPEGSEPDNTSELMKAYSLSLSDYLALRLGNELAPKPRAGKPLHVGERLDPAFLSALAYRRARRNSRFAFLPLYGPAF